MLSTIIAFIVAIGILIFVHELGHFIVARRQGVRVLKFSLGFGPKLIGKKIGDTEYAISAIPLGGYVKMAGESPFEEAEKTADEFSSKTIWQRAKVVMAGPMMNVVLAFALMPLVYLIGTKVPAYLEAVPTVGWVESDSPAEKVGILRGDRVLKVDGKEVHNWERMLTLVASHPERPVTLEIDRSGTAINATLTPKADPSTGAGISGLMPEMPTVISKVSPGYPAGQAGLKPGDRIVSVDGTPVSHWYQVSQYIRPRVGQMIKFGIDREGQSLEIQIAPIKDTISDHGVIGVANLQNMVERKFGLVESVQKGLSRMAELTGLTFDVLKQLFSFNVSIKTLGGPIMIAQLTGEAASSGVADFIGLLAFLSLQLGILNLLPIPVLDGGWLLFLLIEAVKGSPLNRRSMEVAQTVGFAFLITLIVVVSYNDIMRLFR
ncbi:MAG: RIP metalloprotease RseP [Nitrospirae bacterium]|nr:RIP metalloprotease RseP [Nitrospirota bacterium]